MKWPSTHRETEQGGLVIHWFADGTVGNPVEALRGWTTGGRSSLGAGLDVCSMVSLSVLFLPVAPWRCVQVALLSCFHRHGLLLHLSSHCRLTLSTASQSEYCFAWDACQVLNYESEESDWCRWPWPLFITVTIQNPSHTQSSGQWLKDQL